IGLALVQELVRLHGGAIEVSSEVGRGSTFRVRLPWGRAHLPAQQVRLESSGAVARDVQAYLHEALRWVPLPATTTTQRVALLRETGAAVESHRFAGARGARVLLAD